MQTAAITLCWDVGVTCGAWHDPVFGATAAEPSCKSECSQEHLRDTAGLVFKLLLIVMGPELYQGHLLHDCTSRKVRTEIWSWGKPWYVCCSCQEVTAGPVWLYRDAAGTRFITYPNNIRGIDQSQSYSDQWVLVSWMVVQICGVPNAGYAVSEG